MTTCGDCGKEILHDGEGGWYDITTSDLGHQVRTYYCRASPAGDGAPNAYTMTVDYHSPGATESLSVSSGAGAVGLDPDQIT